MSSGRVHFVANVSVGLAFWGFMSITENPNTIPLSLGLALGTIITPDYDYKNIRIKNKIEKNVPIIGSLWTTFWLPYALIFKHRGLSHNIIIGTPSRFLYLLIIPLFIFRNYIDIQFLFILFLGWYLQDLVHYFFDMKIFSRKDS